MNEKILIADDQPEILDLLSESLRGQRKDTVLFERGEPAVAYMREHPSAVDMAIVDLDFGSGEINGLEILRQIREIAPSLPVIILTGKGTIEAAVTAMKLGADDFVEKDLHMEDKLGISISKLERMLRVLEENVQLRKKAEDLHRENRFYREEFGRKYRIVSVSPKIGEVLRQVTRIASIPRPVLIVGARGTGKELIAAAIHYRGVRRKKPFVRVNCAALADALLESELFGHEKGAFTGATGTKIGRFELADGGTLFLDEIANTSLDFQKKILRVIEYQEFERAGGTETLSVDVRVIAATNADLEEEIRKARFREDLYDRLRFAVIPIPPLQERIEDVRPLAEFFIEQIAQEVPGLEVKPLSKRALDALGHYDWPGNVRELKFAVERALCTSMEAEILLEDLPAEIWEGKSTSVGFEDRLDEFERHLLLQTLKESEWNQRKAAEALRLSYDKFRHLYRKHRLGANKP